MHIKKIGRRIYSVTCKGQHIDNQGDFAPYIAVIYMTETGATIEDLMQHLRRKTRDPSIVINEVEVKDKYYKMDVETFIANAQITD